MSRRAAIATAMTALMLPVLLWLGAWQWSKRDWKSALLARIEASASLPPSPLVLGQPGSAAPLYGRVSVTGAFNHQGLQRVWTSSDGKTAHRIMTPLIIKGDFRADRCGRVPVIFVDRGLVPLNAEVTDQPQGEVTINGRLFPSESSPFVSSGGKNGVWTLIDLPAMANAVYPLPEDCTPDGDTNPFYPAFIEADAAASATAPQPELRVIQLSNRHLEYALTWWSFAGILLIIWAVFVRSDRHKRHEITADNAPRSG
jgi:surfeit locus 1 family protein